MHFYKMLKQFYVKEYKETLDASFQFVETLVQQSRLRVSGNTYCVCLLIEIACLRIQIIFIACLVLIGISCLAVALECLSLYLLRVLGKMLPLYNSDQNINID